MKISIYPQSPRISKMIHAVIILSMFPSIFIHYQEKSPILCENCIALMSSISKPYLPICRGLKPILSNFYQNIRTFAVPVNFAMFVTASERTSRDQRLRTLSGMAVQFVVSVLCLMYVWYSRGSAVASFPPHLLTPLSSILALPGCLPGQVSSLQGAQSRIIIICCFFFSLVESVLTSPK